MTDGERVPSVTLLAQTKPNAISILFRQFNAEPVAHRGEAHSDVFIVEKKERARKDFGTTYAIKRQFIGKENATQSSLLAERSYRELRMLWQLKQLHRESRCIHFVQLDQSHKAKGVQQFPTVGHFASDDVFLYIVLEYATTDLYSIRQLAKKRISASKLAAVTSAPASNNTTAVTAVVDFDHSTSNNNNNSSTSTATTTNSAIIVISNNTTTATGTTTTNNAVIDDGLKNDNNNNNDDNNDDDVRIIDATSSTAAAVAAAASAIDSSHSAAASSNSTPPTPTAPQRHVTAQQRRALSLSSSSSIPLRSSAVVVATQQQQRSKAEERLDALLDVLKDPLSFVAVVFQVLWALAIAQRQYALVHNDMHLKNILLCVASPSQWCCAYADDVGQCWFTEGVVVKITDFGLSRMTLSSGEVLFNTNNAYSELFDAALDIRDLAHHLPSLRQALLTGLCNSSSSSTTTNSDDAAWRSFISAMKKAPSPSSLLYHEYFNVLRRPSPRLISENVLCMSTLGQAGAKSLKERIDAMLRSATTNTIDTDYSNTGFDNNAAAIHNDSNVDNNNNNNNNNTSTSTANFNPSNTTTTTTLLTTLDSQSPMIDNNNNNTSTSTVIASTSDYLNAFGSPVDCTSIRQLRRDRKHLISLQHISYSVYDPASKMQYRRQIDATKSNKRRNSAPITKPKSRRTSSEYATTASSRRLTFPNSDINLDQSNAATTTANILSTNNNNDENNDVDNDNEEEEEAEVDDLIDDRVDEDENAFDDDYVGKSIRNQNDNNNNNSTNNNNNNNNENVNNLIELKDEDSVVFASQHSNAAAYDVEFINVNDDDDNDNDNNIVEDNAVVVHRSNNVELRVTDEVPLSILQHQQHQQHQLSSLVQQQQQQPQSLPSSQQQQHAQSSTGSTTSTIQPFPIPEKTTQRSRLALQWRAVAQVGLRDRKNRRKTM